MAISNFEATTVLYIDGLARVASSSVKGVESRDGVDRPAGITGTCMHACMHVQHAL